MNSIARWRLIGSTSYGKRARYIATSGSAGGKLQPPAIPVNAQDQRLLLRELVYSGRRLRSRRSGGFGEVPAVVRCREIELGAQRDDSARIEIGHTAVIA